MSPLKTHAGIVSSEMLFTVTSDAAPIDASDQLSAWQVRLDIVPLDGATGSLSFHSADVPDDNHIFDGLGKIGQPAVQNGGSGLFNFEATFPIASVEVTSSGLNLFKTEYIASPDALGSIGIFALSGSANTIWADGTLAEREFANVPRSGGNQQIGLVTVHERAVNQLQRPSPCRTQSARGRRSYRLSCPSAYVSA